jgi:hypothetical protein
MKMTPIHVLMNVLKNVPFSVMVLVLLIGACSPLSRSIPKVRPSSNEFSGESAELLPPVMLRERQPSLFHVVEAEIEERPRLSAEAHEKIQAEPGEFCSELVLDENQFRELSEEGSVDLIRRQGESRPEKVQVRILRRINGPELVPFQAVLGQRTLDDNIWSLELWNATPDLIRSIDELRVKICSDDRNRFEWITSPSAIRVEENPYVRK